jgi:hypothetical protein
MENLLLNTGCSEGRYPKGNFAFQNMFIMQTSREHHHKEKFPQVVSSVYFSRDRFGRSWWPDKFPDDIRSQYISLTRRPFVLVRLWIGTIPGTGRNENQQVTCDRERESDNVNEWWGSMHDKALLFGTDGDWVHYLRAGQHVATEKALGHANSFSNTV